MKLLRWILTGAAAMALAVACDRADRDLGDYDVGVPTSPTANRNPDASGGAGGDAGGADAVGGAGGTLPGSFCEQPGTLCQDCVQCELQGGDCGIGFNECQGFQDCAVAMACLQDCLVTCTGSDPACVDLCEADCEQQPGFGEAIAVLDCFCRINCPNACADDQVSGCVGYLP